MYYIYTCNVCVDLVLEKSGCLQRLVHRGCGVPLSQKRAMPRQRSDIMKSDGFHLWIL